LSVKSEINIVWLKRDFRTQDHRPLLEAENASLPYLVLSFLEPSILNHPDTSLRHVRFIVSSVKQMIGTIPVHLLCGEAVEVLKDLALQYNINSIFSHQESGTMKTWTRDNEVKEYCESNNITWEEYQRDGIQRGIVNRKGWDRAWYITMHEPIISNAYSNLALGQVKSKYSFKDTSEFTIQGKKIGGKELMRYPKIFQPAGETNAWKYLSSFTKDRGKNYHRHISKPLLSRTSCGRISPYLAWGNISIKQAYQYIKNHPNRPNNKRAFSGILTRLKWHCHFIQKFEVECRYETHCVNRGYETLEHANNDKLLKAWKTGKTGFPMVDSCMRAVKCTGWINFRMRAMLVSFLCHHLDQDWRRGVYHLAQQFLDYEPGIHYPQFQMQAGTTGVNTIRMYNPVKQSQDHDSEGVFIKKWIPELKNVPMEFIHEPWLMTEMDKALYNLENFDYPPPIIDLKTEAKKARDKIWAHRKDKQVVEEKLRILVTHTRNDLAKKKEAEK